MQEDIVKKARQGRFAAQSENGTLIYVEGLDDVPIYEKIFERYLFSEEDDTGFKFFPSEYGEKEEIEKTCKRAVCAQPATSGVLKVLNLCNQTEYKIYGIIDRDLGANKQCVHCLKNILILNCYAIENIPFIFDNFTNKFQKHCESNLNENILRHEWMLDDELCLPTIDKGKILPSRKKICANGVEILPRHTLLDLLRGVKIKKSSIVGKVGEVIYREYSDEPKQPSYLNLVQLVLNINENLIEQLFKSEENINSGMYFKLEHYTNQFGN